MVTLYEQLYQLALPGFVVDDTPPMVRSWALNVKKFISRKRPRKIKPQQMLLPGF